MCSVVQEQKDLRELYGEIQSNAQLQQNHCKDFAPQTVTDQQVTRYIEQMEKILPSLLHANAKGDSEFRKSVRELLSSRVKVRQDGGTPHTSGLINDLDRLTGRRPSRGDIDRLMSRAERCP